jgi:tetratricopeptide (TPR) repeat protein
MVMESQESEKPIPPATLPKRARKKRKKKAAPPPKPKHLTIIKSSAEREDLEKGERNQNGTGSEPSVREKSPFFQKPVSLRSSEASGGLHSRRRRRRGSRARRLGWLRLLRFHLKFGFRKARRIHDRFTFRQILGFYIGVPAAISLIFCVAFLLMKPPKGVSPNAVSSRKPSATELVQQIQSALRAKDSRSSHSAMEGLETFYPNDPRTFVARGTVFAQEKNFDEARKSYSHALELAPDLAPALINLGEVEFAVGNYGEAAKYYERAGQRLPRNSLILFRRYLCYSLLNDRSRSESVIGELDARPYSVEWYFIQASEAIRAGKHSEAQRFLSSAKTLFGEQAAAYQESLKKIGWLK